MSDIPVLSASAQAVEESSRGDRVMVVLREDEDPRNRSRSTRYLCLLSSRVARGVMPPTGATRSERFCFCCEPRAQASSYHHATVSELIVSSSLLRAGRAGERYVTEGTKLLWQWQIPSSSAGLRLGDVTNISPHFAPLPHQVGTNQAMRLLI